MSQNDESRELRPWKGRAILHVDLDAFFASVEQLDHPEWRGKPVIVGGDARHRGVVATCSYEARVFGVRSAMPSVRAEQLCPRAIWAPPRFPRYREIASKVREIFLSETPLVQPVSIDEAYLDVTPGRYVSVHPVHVAQRIKAKVAELGITCSVGVATVKSIAKIASDFEKPNGLTIVWPGEERAFLAPLPLSVMPGLGPQTVKRLATLGIHNLGALAGLDDVAAIEVLGSCGPTMVARARGEDPREVHDSDVTKSVSAEQTFATDLHSADEIEQALRQLCARLGRRLRRSGMVGRTVTVKVRYSDFTTRTAQRTLRAATDDEARFYPLALELVRSLWSPGIGIRLLGVGLSGFADQAEQLELMEPETPAERAPVDDARSRQLVKSIDKVRDKFGDKSLRTGRDLSRDEECETP
ncbi:MAG: DNA polymerase IV [Coriobacteriia bacterium]